MSESGNLKSIENLPTNRRKPTSKSNIHQNCQKMAIFKRTNVTGKRVLEPAKYIPKLEEKFSKQLQYIGDVIVNKDLPEKSDSTELEEYLKLCSKTIKNVVPATEKSDLQNAYFPVEDLLRPIHNEYNADIYAHMKDLEVRMKKPIPGYMGRQPELDARMRSEQVDWVVKITARGKMTEQTLHLAVYYIDTFMSRMAVAKTKFQLLTCAATFLACKYEEITTPYTSAWLQETGTVHTKHQLCQMERMLLKLLTFEMSWPTTYSFISHICYIEKIMRKEAFLAFYIAELMLLEGEPYLQYRPSELASAAVLLSRYILENANIWPNTLKDYSSYTVVHLLPIVTLQHKTLSEAPKRPQKVIFKKYSSLKRDKVALLAPKMLNMSDFSTLV